MTNRVHTACSVLVPQHTQPDKTSHTVRHWSLKSTSQLQIGADKANGLGSYVLGAAWPRFSGAAYFAIFFCGARQVRLCVQACVSLISKMPTSSNTGPTEVLSATICNCDAHGSSAVQLIAFFYVTWFIHRMEHGHRRAFLLQYQIDPDTCGFSHATNFDVVFLATNVLVITGTMTNELLDLYECSGSVVQQLTGNCSTPATAMAPT